MNLHRLFHRDSVADLPPLSEEEWAPIAAALRAMPDSPAPRDFRLTAEQAASLRRRPLWGRLALPAPVATGVAAVLVLVVLAPSLLGGLGGASSGEATAAPGGAEQFAPADRNSVTATDNFAGGYEATAGTGPKAADFCPPRVPEASPTPEPSPTPSPTPEPVDAGATAVPVPAPSCDPGP